MIENQSWNIMYKYLIDQENCIIKDKEITVKNLYKTLQLYKEMINQHSDDERGQNLNCIFLKKSLERIYKAHKQNKFKKITSIK